MMVYCWANVVDGGPALNHYWITVACSRRDVVDGCVASHIKFVPFLKYVLLNPVICQSHAHFEHAISLENGLIERYVY